MADPLQHVEVYNDKSNNMCSASFEDVLMSYIEDWLFYRVWYFSVRACNID